MALERALLAFEILVNGKKRQVVGDLSADMLSITLQAISAELRKRPDPRIRLVANGIASGSAESHLSWPDHTGLSVGDEITVRIVEVDAADTPAVESAQTPANRTAAKKLYELLHQEIEG